MCSASSMVMRVTERLSTMSRYKPRAGRAFARLSTTCGCTVIAQKHHHDLRHTEKRRECYHHPAIVHGVRPRQGLHVNVHRWFLVEPDEIPLGSLPLLPLLVIALEAQRRVRSRDVPHENGV